MALPENISASYPDRSAGDIAHKADHDEVHGILNDPGANWTAGNDAYLARAGGLGFFDVTAPAYGATGDGTTDDTAAINLAIDAASAAGGGVVYFPKGTFLTDGISLAAKDCTLIGAGSQQTVIKANAGIAGYVISVPATWGAASPNAESPVPFGGFLVEGTGAADATKARGGVSFVSVGAMHAVDVGIKNTGGPCAYLEGCQLADFDQFTFNRPIGADTNDVPYLHIVGACNGNRYAAFGFRSTTTSPDGTSVVLVEPSASYTPTTSKFIAPWLEFQHTPENGSVFDITANGYVIEDMQQFDCEAASGNTNACIARFRTAGATTNHGGNEWRGQVPGNGGTATSYAYGIILAQNNNRVIGTKGYSTNNVRIDAGYSGNHVEVGGRQSSAGTPTVVDNSGVYTNTVVDWTARTISFGKVKLEANATSEYLYLYDRDAGPGQLWLGDGGPRVMSTDASPTGMYLDAATFNFRNLSYADRVLLNLNGGAALVRLVGEANNRTVLDVKAAASNLVDIAQFKDSANTVLSGVNRYGALRTLTSTTAARPSASASGAGAMVFDTTLGKPIWSNGTDWVDATGAVA